MLSSLFIPLCKWCLFPPSLYSPCKVPTIPWQIMNLRLLMRIVSHLIECFPISDENGAVEKFGFLNTKTGSEFCFHPPRLFFSSPCSNSFCNLKKKNFLFIYFTTLPKDPEDTLSYLKGIKPGRIVLMASFDDVTPKWVKASTWISANREQTLWPAVAAAAAASTPLPFNSVAGWQEKRWTFSPPWEALWSRLWRPETAGCLPGGRGCSAGACLRRSVSGKFAPPPLLRNSRRREKDN